MIKRLLAVGAVLSILSLYGCSVDCEVCNEFVGTKDCQTVKDVKKSECEDCGTDVGAIQDSDLLVVQSKISESGHESNSTNQNLITYNCSYFSIMKYEQLFFLEKKS